MTSQPNTAYLSSRLPEAPRNIDPARTFTALVTWLERLITEKNAPGFIVGISGTDSIITFLACAKAFEKVGRPERALGIHYGTPFPPPQKTPEEITRLLQTNPSYRWVARTVIPWLQEQAPQSRLLVESGIDYNDDYQRWASLFKSSLNGAEKTEPLPAGENYWVVSTRNATEQVLGAYSNISGAASLQPIVHLWKNEILKICAHLGVPSLALEKSRQVDCDCGRFDIAANHISEVDAALMVRCKTLHPSYLHRTIAPDLLEKIEAFIEDQISYTAFKKEIPHIPPADTVMET